MGKVKLTSEHKRHQRIGAGIVSEANYFARRCGLSTEEAVALMTADHGSYETQITPIKNKRGRKSAAKNKPLRAGKRSRTK
ncbi:hypothetical protein [Mesorhizobium neociceri]|uniref:Uncharacterized protein n=1 Tax=Mesorhizobium neociceri TaxID=1307853 RepID=A0A838BDV7_9HYPH|nr:hypothetical protein [Mesorhizobium neociceri]MBA1144736.1 hypothetical protein [Mesorhizobium neociceri]